LIELFKDIFQFFKKNIWTISKLTLAIEFPFILIQNIHYFGSASSEFSNNVSSIFFLITLVIYPFSTGAQISLYSMILQGAEIDLKKCIFDSLKNLMNLILASLIYLSFTFLGLLAFIIPGIIIGVRLSFYSFFIVLDDLKPFDALKKSAQVTKEYTWLMAGSLFIIGSLLILPMFFIQLTLNRFGLYNLFSATLLDSIFAILGWLSLILVFRFYCLYKDQAGKARPKID
jgi:hypothetical protein